MSNVAVLTLLRHRGVLARPSVTYSNGKSVTAFNKRSKPSPIFITLTNEQEQQDDTTPTTPSQRNAVILARSGIFQVGDRVEVTRPAGLGTFKVVEIVKVPDGMYGLSHDECQCEEVVPNANAQQA